MKPHIQFAFEASAMNAVFKVFEFFLKPSNFIGALLGLAAGGLVLNLFLRELTEHESFSNFRHVHNLKRDLSHIGVKVYPMEMDYERKDWNDHAFIKYEATRKGHGEQGRGVYLIDPQENLKDTKLEMEEGLHVVISDKISVNRSLQDTRPKE